MIVLENFFFSIYGVWVLFGLATAVIIYVRNGAELDGFNRFFYSAIWAGFDCLIADLIVKGFFVILGMTEWEAMFFTCINWSLILCFFFENDIIKPYWKNRKKPRFVGMMGFGNFSDAEIEAFKNAMLDFNYKNKIQTYSSKYIMKKSYKSY